MKHYSLRTLWLLISIILLKYIILNEQNWKDLETMSHANSNESHPLPFSNQRLLRATSSQIWYEFEPIWSLSCIHIHSVSVFKHEPFMLSSLLGLRRPFLCSRVFCSIFPFHFWFHKGTFSDQVWNQKTITLQGTGRHESAKVVRHILAFVTPPRYTYTLTLNW